MAVRAREERARRIAETTAGIEEDRARESSHGLARRDHVEGALVGPDREQRPNVESVRVELEAPRIARAIERAIAPDHLRDHARARGVVVLVRRARDRVSVHRERAARDEELDEGTQPARADVETLREHLERAR